MPKTNEAMRPIGQMIVVVDNGFVYHGEVTIDDDFCLISGAKNIRVWGTKKGLGELRNGPLKETVLDDCGEVLVPKGRVCHFIKASWKP